MKTLITYSLLIISMSAMFNCKKYPEGGWHFNAIKHLEGQWKLKLYEVNNIDSTNLINYNGNDNYKKISFNRRQGVYNKDLDCRINGKNAVNIDFDSNRENLTFESGGVNSPLVCETLISSDCYKLIFTPEIENYSMKWRVLTLSKNELKLACKYKNRYLIILTK